MSAQEVIAGFNGLPPEERAEVARFVVENDNSWIPQSFRHGLAAATAGPFAGLENELQAMANDPQIQRELRSIDTEFIPAESDGLGKI